ncbi:hypothetical protein [Halalkalibacter sp. APA_J-10(15)]|uniref:hypothetical protein n=1 Tax=unclassified Halalkalibacter TaxID=2893063 RepID=UPI001FF54BF3|nr:hypothetical protein [Halalkalibacter sp. APA_J-10(15)]MCK0470317.1 hypothetical protein [Halalkalibacter sp. APA_J-10(15)]
MKKKQKHSFIPDQNAREQAFLDVDRMINEGLGGGTVHGHDSGLIEETRGSLEQEDPPNSTDH